MPNNSVTITQSEHVLYRRQTQAIIIFIIRSCTLSVILPVSMASSSSHISYKSAPFPLTRSPINETENRHFTVGDPEKGDISSISAHPDI